jgi:hypothetical protein
MLRTAAESSKKFHIALMDQIPIVVSSQHQQLGSAQKLTAVSATFSIETCNQVSDGCVFDYRASTDIDRIADTSLQMD